MSTPCTRQEGSDADGTLAALPGSAHHGEGTVARPQGDRQGRTSSPNPGRVDYLNGTGLGTLVALHRRARRGGGQLTLANMAAHLGEPTAAVGPEVASEANQTVSDGADDPERSEHTEPWIGGSNARQYGPD
jgi:hypothetical protein